MSERWTADERKPVLTGRFGWILAVVLGLIAFGLLGYTAWRITSKASDVASILGEWQADDPPWHAVFRSDKTLGITFNGKSAPTTLAPAVMTPGLEIAGRYIKGPEGTYHLKLQNGKSYEASFNKYVPDRFDLTDAEGASAVITFKKVKSPEDMAQPGEDSSGGPSR
jgi:hypothetical protein